MAKKDMTLEELARMTHEGFEAVDEKLVSLETRMTAKLDESEGRLLQAIAGVEIRRPEFETLQADVRELTDRVDSLEKKV